MRSLKRLFFFTAMLTTLASCKVFESAKVVPDFNAAIVKDVTDLGKQVDILYITMEESEDKSYETYTSDYQNGEMLINSIVARNQARPKSAAIVKQSILYRDLYLRYRNEHKTKGKLNNSEIRIYKRYLQDQLTPLLVSELSLK